MMSLQYSILIKTPLCNEKQNKQQQAYSSEDKISMEKSES